MTELFQISNGIDVISQRLAETSRERPKSAPYLRLKIEKGGPFGLCETPAGCKKRKKN